MVLPEKAVAEACGRIWSCEVTQQFVSRAGKFEAGVDRVNVATAAAKEGRRMEAALEMRWVEAPWVVIRGCVDVMLLNTELVSFGRRPCS